MTEGMPNLSLMLLFPLICMAVSVLMDVLVILARRRRPYAFPGGANRLYWSVMITAMLRSVVFSLLFVPAVALEGQIVAAIDLSKLEMSVLMVLPALFGAYFATRLERHVLELLESALLRDRAQFLNAPRRANRPEAGS